MTKAPRPINPRTITTLDDLPLLLTIDEVAAIYRLQPKTVRNKLSKGLFVPEPFLRHPIRWRRDDIARHLAGPDLVRLNNRRPRRIPS